MIAKDDTLIKDAATTIYELSEDERIQQQCEARMLYMYEQRKNRRQMRELKKELKEAQDQLTQQSEQLSQQSEKIEKQSTNFFHSHHLFYVLERNTDNFTIILSYLYYLQNLIFTITNHRVRLKK